MGEFWGFVDWGAGCLALSVAVVFSFLLGVRTGRIRERNESVRSRIRQNKANMYRYKQQLASYQEQVVRLERERDSLVIRSEAYDRIETELTAYRQKMEQLEREILVLSGDNNLLDNATGKVDVDVPKLLCALKDDPLHVNPSKEEWAEIIGMTDLLFNNFLTDLRNKYSITRHEQEICCLIKWNFSRKEQLAVFNNTPDALTKSKGRLKKLEEVQTILSAGAGGSTKLVADGGKRMQRIFNFKYPTEYIQRFAEVLERKKGVADFYDHDLGPEASG